MWSHYSNSHKGFALEFLPEHYFFDQREKQYQLAWHIKKIRYTEQRPKFVFFDKTISIEENYENWINNFIWVKSDHWSYEKEWRILATLKGCKNVIKQNGDVIYLFPIPYDAIKSIYIGCRMSPEKKEQIFNLIEAEQALHHIKIFHAIPDDKEYKLNFNLQHH
jgi:hypothetical protein